MHCGFQNHFISTLNFLILIIVLWLHKRISLSLGNAHKLFLVRGNDVYNFLLTSSEKKGCVCVHAHNKGKKQTGG